MKNQFIEKAIQKRHKTFKKMLNPIVREMQIKAMARKKFYPTNLAKI